MPPAGSCVLSEEQELQIRRPRVLPRCRNLPQEISSDDERMYVSGVEEGQSLYASTGSPTVCLVALSWFGSSNGCIGFLGGVDSGMFNIVTHIVNRSWTPSTDETEDDEVWEEEVDEDDEGDYPNETDQDDCDVLFVSPISSCSLGVLSTGEQQAAIGPELGTMGLKNHHTTMSLRTRADYDRPWLLLNRPPLTAPLHHTWPVC